MKRFHVEHLARPQLVMGCSCLWAAVANAVSPHVPATTPLEHSLRSFLLQTTAELAGLFWLAAELAILFAVLVARRHLAAEPLPIRLRLVPHERHRATCWVWAMAALTMAVLSRHLFLVPLPVLLATDGLTGLNAAAALAQAIHIRNGIHAILWTAFVAGWVILECAIVYHGLRVYQRLRRLVVQYPARSPYNGVGFFALLFLTICVTVLRSRTVGAAVLTASDQATVYFAAYQADAALRNAVLLLLRCAGVVWIAVEWAAACILLRCFRLLKPFGGC
jgi:hypothetical protein